MFRVLFLLLISTHIYAGEFNFKLGASISNERSAKPEVDLPSPLGILRFEYKTEKENIIFCEHISSIPSDEEGHGLNHCGFLIGL